MEGSKTPLFYFPADTAGFEPATSHCADIVVDAGALPFKSYASCDSFLVYHKLGESSQGRTDALSLTRGQRVSGLHKPRPSTKDRRTTSSVHPSVPHGHHCPCDPPVSQHDRSSRAVVGLRHPAAPPRQPACRHLPNGPQKRGS